MGKRKTSELTREEREFYASFTPSRINRPELKAGDRVIVTNPDHPHYEEVGEVTTAPRPVSIMGRPPELWLEMRGEWEEFGVRPHEVRRIRDL